MIKKNSLSQVIWIIIFIFFVITLLPIIWVGLHNYATGDDYWYGYRTSAMLRETGVLGALKGSCITVKDFYLNWQGTWFTMFLFTLSPNMWGEHWYYGTIFIALGLLIAGVTILLYYYFVTILQFPKTSFAILDCLILYAMIQYMPRTISSLFWFNGVMHYNVPFFLGCLAIVHGHKYFLHHKKKDFLFLCIECTLLGGGSYLAPLVVLLYLILLFLAQIEFKKEPKLSIYCDKNNYWIILPLSLELVGLLISFLAPGNNVRGGEEFGLNLKWALQTILYAVDRGIKLGIRYFYENPFLIVVLLCVIIVSFFSFWGRNYEPKQFKLPVLYVLCMNGIYWASYTPEIYSRSDVSGGVNNTYFFIFLLVNLANIVYVNGRIVPILSKKMKKKNTLSKPSKKRFFMAASALVIGGLATNIWYSPKTTNAYCVEYIKSGKMAEYVKVREEQSRILWDETITDAVIPECEGTYPVLNMLLSDNPKYPPNMERAMFYGKNSVIAYRVDEK